MSMIDDPAPVLACVRCSITQYVYNRLAYAAVTRLQPVSDGMLFCHDGRPHHFEWFPCEPLELLATVRVHSSIQ
jgi:hypothetical protein